MDKIKAEYVCVYKHKGIDILVLNAANPSKGDSLKYMVKNFEGEFNTVQEAIDTIDKTNQKNLRQF